MKYRRLKNCYFCSHFGSANSILLYNKPINGWNTGVWKIVIFALVLGAPIQYFCQKLIFTQNWKSLSELVRGKQHTEYTEFCFAWYAKREIHKTILYTTKTSSCCYILFLFALRQWELSGKFLLSFRTWTEGHASNTYIIDMSFPRIPIICAIFRKFAKPIFQSKRIGDKSYGDLHFFCVNLFVSTRKGVTLQRLTQLN